MTFPTLKVHNLGFWKSDHRPILFHVASETDFLGKVVNGVRRQFHFEEAWINLVECDMIIKENWCHLAAPINVQGVSNNIKSCFTVLGDWNIKSRARLRRDIREKILVLRRLNSKL
ncbi:hypothetical protein ACOSQ2_032152 [Xanthoceras sorbifolium]